MLKWLFQENDYVGKPVLSEHTCPLFDTIGLDTDEWPGPGAGTPRLGPVGAAGKLGNPPVAEGAIGCLNGVVAKFPIPAVTPTDPLSWFRGPPEDIPECKPERPLPFTPGFSPNFWCCKPGPPCTPARFCGIPKGAL